MSTRKFNKSRGEDMKSAFGRADTELADISNEVTVQANKLASGGLLGLAGDELHDTLASTLAGKINLLVDKMGEMNREVQKAREDYEEAERRARERFVY